jgi:hypothetical protein
VVTVHSVMSTRVDVAKLGGKFELLVCEIVDDLLLGESVLTTVADARRRLLTRDAIILPRGGSLWALPVELLPPHRPSDAAVEGDDGPAADTRAFQSLHALSLLTANPNDALQLRHYHGQYRALGPPVELLAFDWASMPLRRLTTEGACGASAPTALPIHTEGVLTALVVYLHLDLNGEAANRVSTGPDSPNIAWDQCARHLPMPLRVQPGDELSLIAKHTDCYLQTLALSGFTAEMLDQSPSYGGCLAHLVGAPNAQGLSVTMELAAATRAR